MALPHTARRVEDDVLVPVVLVADVARDVGEVMLAVRESDLNRMQHVEPVNVIVA